jgi:hypothetical protein
MQGTFSRVCAEVLSPDRSCEVALCQASESRTHRALILPVRSDHLNYSRRRAVDGSSELARQAGTAAARADDTTSTIAALPSVDRLRGATP